MKSATVPLLAMGAIFAAIYWLGGKAKAASGLKICKVTLPKLDKWAAAAEVALYYFPNKAEPDTLEALSELFSVVAIDLAAGREIVVVTQGDRFWIYDASKPTELPAESPELKASYCDFATR